jgi:hypothetical protein
MNDERASGSLLPACPRAARGPGGGVGMRRPALRSVLHVSCFIFDISRLTASPFPQTTEQEVVAVTNWCRKTIGGLAAALFLAAFPPAAGAAPWDIGSALRDAGRPANAQPGRRGPAPGDARGPAYRRGADRDARPGMGQEPRRDMGRESRREPRLSPEERSQLRRDIKDAGRQIYFPRRR